jgi:hypothetical protein
MATVITPSEEYTVDSLQNVYDTRGLILWLVSVALFLLLFVWMLVQQSRLGGMGRRNRRMTRGASGGNFDDVMERHLRRLEETAQRLDDLAAQCSGLDLAVRGCLQRIGIVRFNPFEDVGGDQSFSIALLDAKGDGIVISSLYGRRESRVYLKPIDRGQSKYALSEEEGKALRLAEAQRTGQRERGHRSAAQE